ncbi:origin recognition complex subunit 5 [Loa loa]|uniref:Origin recognition complex subunit 5 n=1 Tax=Loa loa TaxID=7209 RepID=A0A1I7W1Y2_LOALO|nr:origin recognition complex subunit 5 [Loa loa]EFO27437.1 origin recognition complex subunit 5 [Loa loa]
MSAMEATCSKKLWQIVSVLRCRNSSITHLHVYGTTAGPKDEVMQKVIEEVKENDEVMVLRVNCYVNHRSHKLFCQGLYNLLPHSKPGKKIENLESVFEECKTELQYVKSVIMVVILNNAEMLLNFPPSFLQALFSIPKKYGGTIKLVSVARLPWTRFEITEHISSPVQFAFEALSKGEVQEALSTRLNFDNNFVRCMLDMVYSVCRDLNQLSYIIEKLWDTGTNDENWANSAASNKLKTCYAVRGQNSTDDLFYRSERRPEEDGQSFCLSTSAKYLLIAAYCASYNPPSSDRRFFTKNHGKQRRRAPATKGLRNNLESAHETGPKPFPIQRLLFIYLAMLEKHDMRNHCAADIHAQVAELCAMGFLNRVSADGNLDTPKYRCIATFEFSEQLAKTVGIEIRDFLIDFSS